MQEHNDENDDEGRGGGWGVVQLLEHTLSANVARVY